MELEAKLEAMRLSTIAINIARKWERIDKIEN